MFNDLNNQKPGRPAVDDIFAETDKSQDNPSSPSEIEAKKVGLTAAENLVAEEPEKKRGAKWLTITLIVVGAVILVLVGYLVYERFFKATSDFATDTKVLNGKKATNTDIVAKPKATATPEVKTNDNEQQPSLSASSTSPASQIPEIPGVNVPLATTTVVATATEPIVDTDNDGLTDSEEQKEYHTNYNVSDTDHDGLNDYEEVRIYQTNPLNSDSDGDGYLDGAEVKNGYNPNGAGKLSGNR